MTQVNSKFNDITNGEHKHEKPHQPSARFVDDTIIFTIKFLIFSAFLRANTNKLSKSREKLYETLSGGVWGEMRHESLRENIFSFTLTTLAHRKPLLIIISRFSFPGSMKNLLRKFVTF